MGGTFNLSWFFFFFFSSHFRGLSLIYLSTKWVLFDGFAFFVATFVDCR